MKNMFVVFHAVFGFSIVTAMPSALHQHPSTIKYERQVLQNLRVKSFFLYLAGQFGIFSRLNKFVDAFPVMRIHKRFAQPVRWFVFGAKKRYFLPPANCANLKLRKSVSLLDNRLSSPPLYLSLTAYSDPFSTSGAICEWYVVRRCNLSVVNVREPIVYNNLPGTASPTSHHLRVDVIIL